jgi:hypothetical protein
MTRIARTAQVCVPQRQAISLVDAFFLQRSKLNVKGIGPSSASVDVRYELLYDWTTIARRNDAVAFAWKPQWRGFPPFGATLTVRAAGQDSQLVLEGSYDPPAGAAGRLFDLIVGKGLARRTMDGLLRDITGYVEGAYAKG